MSAAAALWCLLAHGAFWRELHYSGPRRWRCDRPGCLAQRRHDRQYA